MNNELVRVTVAELYRLQETIEGTGEVHAAILPVEAYSSTSLVIAWARSVNGENFVLSIWRDSDSWRKNFSAGKPQEPFLRTIEEEGHDRAE